MDASKCQLQEKYKSFDFNKATLNDIRSFYGPKPEGTGQTPREEAYGNLKNQYDHMTDRLSKGQVKKGEISRENLTALKNRMWSNEHLRMNDGTLYTKGDHEPGTKKKRFEDHSFRFKSYTRYAKLSRAKRAIQGWLAEMFGKAGQPNDKLAKSVMKRAFGGDGGAMKKPQLEKVLSVAKQQEDLDAILEGLSEDEVYKINNESVANVVEQLESNAGDKVGEMLKLYCQVRGQDLRVFKQLIDGLREEHNDQRLKAVAQNALDHLDLSPDTRRMLKSFVRGRLDFDRDDNLNRFIKRLRRDRDAFVGRKLDEFRNDPKVMETLVKKGYQAALGKIDEENLQQAFPGQRNVEMIRTLTNSDSKVNRAFQLYTQSVGKSATANQQVAEFVDQLGEYDRNFGTWNDAPENRLKLQELAKQVIKIGPQTVRDPKDVRRTLSKLARNQDVTREDIRRLSYDLREDYLAPQVVNFRIEHSRLQSYEDAGNH
ncbi:MAG: hypothetical protein MI861_27330 [Pirellulales bacterium]|nr:hypothetical protein [Pirellulales bacterium]